jgi:hypothetical protein
MGLVVLAVLLVIAVMAFLRTSPHGVDRRKLLAYNTATLALSVPAALAVGFGLHADAVAAKVGEHGIAMYLAVMAGGAAALLVIAVGGLVRNFVAFPRSRRGPPPAAPG